MTIIITTVLPSLWSSRQSKRPSSPKLLMSNDLSTPPPWWCVDWNTLVSSSVRFCPWERRSLCVQEFCATHGTGSTHYASYKSWYQQQSPNGRSLYKRKEQKVKRCRGCTSYVQNFIKHFTIPILPINWFEDKEELHCWIWKSCCVQDVLHQMQLVNFQLFDINKMHPTQKMGTSSVVDISLIMQQQQITLYH
jgi:hypothetical protein